MSWVGESKTPRGFGLSGAEAGSVGGGEAFVPVVSPPTHPRPPVPPSPLALPWTMAPTPVAKMLRIKSQQPKKKPLTLLCKDISTMSTYAAGISKASAVARGLRAPVLVG